MELHIANTMPADKCGAICDKPDGLRSDLQNAKDKGDDKKVRELEGKLKKAEEEKAKSCVTVQTSS